MRGRDASDSTRGGFLVMTILLTGATGFIGSRLSKALSSAGHRVIETRRGPPAADCVPADFTRDLAIEDWLPKLAGVDVVINAVGIIRERGEQTFERIHTRAPQALFGACAQAGVRRVIQISALGADRGTARYYTSKHAADEYLSSLPLDWTIVQPALVYGAGGTSTRLFSMLATLPLIPVAGDGRQRVQPIHIDDLIEAIVALLTRDDTYLQRVPLVGPRPITLRQLSSGLRASLRLRPTRIVPIPLPLMRLGARVGEMFPHSLLDRETLAMLQAGNTADPAMTERLLQRSPRAVEMFIEPAARDARALEAKLLWLAPLLRMSIAIVWIWTGVVSLGLYPRSDSYALLAQVGITGALAPWFLFGAAALDLVLGIATLVLQRRRLLWLLQMAIIVGYTIIISIALPQFWLHPYGPILKNLPMLAAIFLLYTLEAPRWTTSS
jgi:uncharacterized protein YbjT (DUF2867 family)